MCFLIDTGPNNIVIGSFFTFLGTVAPIKFYVLTQLTTFDGIIGDDTLKSLGEERCSNLTKRKIKNGSEKYFER